jgi:hypothetical protein
MTARQERYRGTKPIPILSRLLQICLHFHKNGFLINQNAVYDKKAYRGQMAAGALLRMLSHHYVARERRNGPFYLQLTDVNPSNFFVDENGK